MYIFLAVCGAALLGLPILGYLVLVIHFAHVVEPDTWPMEPR